MAIAVLSELPEFPFHQLADGMLLRKYNRDHATNSAVHSPRKRFSDLPCRPFGGGMRRHVK